MNLRESGYDYANSDFVTASIKQRTAIAKSFLVRSCSQLTAIRTRVALTAGHLSFLRSTIKTKPLSATDTLKRKAMLLESLTVANQQL